jgi:phosphoglycerate dehydrogenase-like enzyme
VKLLFCSEGFRAASDGLREALPGDDVRTCSEKDVLREVSNGDVDIVVPGMALIDESVIAASGTRLIQQFATGVDNIDLASARRHGVPVANIPAATGNAASVGELAVLHLLALARDMRGAERSVRAGVLGTPQGRSLVGRKVVVLGFGAVGQAVATRLQGFDAQVIAVGRRPLDDEIKRAMAATGVHRYVTFESWTRELADVFAILVCLRVTAENAGIIDAEVLDKVPRDAFIVNVARGAAIDYVALRQALATGRIAGAGLDVFWQEPISPDDPILESNITVTPHIAGVTDRAYEAMVASVVRNVEALRQGHPIENRIV